VKIERIENSLRTSVFRKSTDVGHYLQFDSNHSKNVKNGIVNTLLHRADTHCSNINLKRKEKETIKTVLLQNNYPASLIEKIDRGRKKNKEEKEVPVSTVVLPYVPVLSERIGRIGQKYGVRTVFDSKNTLKTNLVHKKPKNKEIKKEIIYEIPCECSKVYIGETCRTLDIRVKEHKNLVKKRVTTASKLAEHVLNTEHRILWDEAKIIGMEPHWKKRKFHEAVEIWKGGNNVISTPSLDFNPIWKGLLKDVSLRKPEKTQLRRSRRLLTGKN
jgi:hypothetical protein